MTPFLAAKQRRRPSHSLSHIEPQQLAASDGYVPLTTNKSPSSSVLCTPRQAISRRTPVVGLACTTVGLEDGERERGEGAGQVAVPRGKRMADARREESVSYSKEDGVDDEDAGEYPRLGR